MDCVVLSWKMSRWCPPRWEQGDALVGKERQMPSSASLDGAKTKNRNKPTFHQRGGPRS